MRQKNPVGPFPNLLCNLINKPSNKQQIGSRHFRCCSCASHDVSTRQNVLVL